MIEVIPDPCASDQEYQRFHHHDLPDLEIKELWHELYALRPLLWRRLPDDSWLQARVEAIEAELAKHRGGKRQGVWQ
jgi:hypothetical protein